MNRITRLTRAERLQLNASLNRWGDWMEKHGDYEGFAGINILESYIGSDLGTPGHRILCLEMPVGVYCTHQRVIKLPELEQQAVWIWYVPTMKANGTTYTVREKCLIVGIREDALRQRISRARLRIAGIDPLRMSQVNTTIRHASEAATEAVVA